MRRYVRIMDNKRYTRFPFAKDSGSVASPSDAPRCSCRGRNLYDFVCSASDVARGQALGMHAVSDHLQSILRQRALFGYLVENGDLGGCIYRCQRFAEKRIRNHVHSCRSAADRPRPMRGVLALYQPPSRTVIARLRVVHCLMHSWPSVCSRASLDLEMFFSPGNHPLYAVSTVASRRRQGPPRRRRPLVRGVGLEVRRCFA